MMPAVQPKIPHTTPAPPAWVTGAGGMGAGAAIDGVAVAKTSAAASAAATIFLSFMTNSPNAT
jgi:hypothetical protein